MITIRIKTWSDYKKQLLDWVKEPRRETCKMYVEYMNSESATTIEKEIEAFGKRNGWDEQTIYALTNAIQSDLLDTQKTVFDLIDTTQPKSIF